MSDDLINPIRRDYLSGMSYVAIGEKYKIDPRTAKRYVQNNLPTEYLEQRPFSSILDHYKPMINKWLKNGRLPSTTIHDRLIEMGCKCGYTIVNDYVQQKMQEYETTASTLTKNWDKEFTSGSFKEQQKRKASIEKSKHSTK